MAQISNQLIKNKQIAALECARRFCRLGPAIIEQIDSTIEAIELSRDDERFNIFFEIEGQISGVKVLGCLDLDVPRE